MKDSPVPSPPEISPDRQLPAGHETKLIESHEQHENRGRAPRGLGAIASGAVIVLAALLVFGLIRHYREQKVVEAAALDEERALPIVNVVKVRPAASVTSQLLPGNMTPLTEAYIYARANGYVLKRYHDIGDRVKRGDLLAVIEAPDLDQQVEQARASLAQAGQQVGQASQQVENARSQEEIARITWERYKALVQHGAVSKQDADQMYATYRSAVASTKAAQANVSAAEQNVQANQANVNRQFVLQSFEHVRAPFSGVITARNFDVGALVGASGGTQGSSSTPLGGTQSSGSQGNAGASGNSLGGVAPSSGTGATPATGVGSGELFRIAQIEALRILVNVPQESASAIRVGQVATVFVQEFPTEKFQGKVTRTANAIDLISRTLLVEVDLLNPQQKLLPGTYAQVQIDNVRAKPPMLVPGDSIIAGANGIQVAVAGEIEERDGQLGRHPPNAKQIHLRTVQVGRDYGPQIEIISGLIGSEQVVVNPGDDVQDGAIVKAVPAASGGKR
jgi:multidrug efflux pump subunit AcrA (membrane-fusion protein)